MEPFTPLHVMFLILLLNRPFLSAASGPRKVPPGRTPSYGAEPALRGNIYNVSPPHGSCGSLGNLERYGPFDTPPDPGSQPPPQQTHKPIPRYLMCPHNAFLPYMSEDGFPNWLSLDQFNRHGVSLESWCRNVAECLCVDDAEVVCPDPEDMDREPRYPMLDWCQDECICVAEHAGQGAKKRRGL